MDLGRRLTAPALCQAGWEKGERRAALTRRGPARQAGVLTGTEAWRAGDRARALEQAFLELDQRMALPEHRGELAELAGAQADEDMQCGAPAPARPAQRALSQRGLSLWGIAGGVQTAKVGA